MDILLDSLHRYYDNKKNMSKLLDVINNNNKVSLRIIDWFVTNYSKKHNIFYTLYKTSTGKLTFSGDGNELCKQFNTYQSYKSQLKSYSKKRFDPFCRRERIYFNYDGDKKIETTIGQLNFFKWAIDHMIIDYIKLHYSEIEEDMNESYNLIKKQKKNSNERKKREELSKSASRGLNCNQVKIILDFN
jgi:hypothetical protein